MKRRIIHSLILSTSLVLLTNCSSEERKGQPGTELTPENIRHLQQKKEVLQLAIETLDSLQKNLDTQVDQLNRIDDAHKIILKELNKNMTQKFVKEQIVQLNIFKAVYMLHNELNKIINVVRVHITGGEITTKQANTMISGMDEDFQQLEDRLTAPDIQSSSQSFKIHIKEAADFLISSNPQNTNTYIELNIELSPENLKQQITELKSVLTGLEIIMQSFK